MSSFNVVAIVTCASRSLDYYEKNRDKVTAFAQRTSIGLGFTVIEIRRALSLRGDELIDNICANPLIYFGFIALFRCGSGADEFASDWYSRDGTQGSHDGKERGGTHLVWQNQCKAYLSSDCQDKRRFHWDAWFDAAKQEETVC